MQDKRRERLQAFASSQKGKAIYEKLERMRLHEVARDIVQANGLELSGGQQGGANVSRHFLKHSLQKGILKNAEVRNMFEVTALNILETITRMEEILWKNSGQGIPLEEAYDLLEKGGKIAAYGIELKAKGSWQKQIELIKNERRWLEASERIMDSNPLRRRKLKQEIIKAMEFSLRQADFLIKKLLAGASPFAKIGFLHAEKAAKDTAREAGQ